MRASVCRRHRLSAPPRARSSVAEIASAANASSAPTSYLRPLPLSAPLYIFSPLSLGWRPGAGVALVTTPPRRKRRGIGGGKKCLWSRGVLRSRDSLRIGEGSRRSFSSFLVLVALLVLSHLHRLIRITTGDLTPGGGVHRTSFGPASLPIPGAGTKTRCRARALRSSELGDGREVIDRADGSFAHVP